MVKASLHQALILAALALVPGLVQAIHFRDKISWRSAVPASEMVTMEQARVWGESVIWVDARPDDEFARDHVPGAFSLNEDRWNELFPAFRERWSPDRKIIVYCSAESCNLARDVAKKLREEEQLPNDIRVLQGGWEEW